MPGSWRGRHRDGRYAVVQAKDRMPALKGVNMSKYVGRKVKFSSLHTIEASYNMGGKGSIISETRLSLEFKKTSNFHFLITKVIHVCC